MGDFASALLRGGIGKFGRFVDPGLLEASYQRQNAHVALDFDNAQGLAWFIDRIPTERFGHTVMHGGSIMGHHSAFVMSRDESVAVLAVTNSARGAGVIQKLAADALALALEVKTGRPAPELPEPKTLAQAEIVDGAVLDRWAGHYSTFLGDVELVRGDGELSCELFNRPFFVRPHEDGTMGLWTKFWGLLDVQPDGIGRLRVALLDVSGHTVVVDETPFGRRFMGAKYTPVVASPEWRKRIGRYLVENDPKAFRFIKGFDIHLGSAGQLMARPIAPMPIEGLPPSTALRPIDASSAVVEGLGRNRGVWFVFDERGGLDVSGLTLKRTSDRDPTQPAE
jgi:hypothetical protein